MKQKIFVSVGTHPQGFNRLIGKLDEIVPCLAAEVFAQTGNSGYEPKNFPFKKFLTEKEFQGKVLQADIVISHGGAGTIINSMLQGKKLIVVPRLKAFSEHTNDHQLDLAKALEQEGKCIAVFGIKSLGKAIESAKAFKPRIASTKENLIREIKEFIEAA
ncbi:MAG: beta-1,4-galactosyltransferase [Candidatus Diapherotrites archaeon]|uniref:Beta-1,4-galactosyltransferase n=1 Tax=Candidatus Iainarchaeum sp. TaxID=3101447 RepID=A0A938YWL5_9ARCH|nr:beta-1,4-galactosyltransferase [Candidatus Diapherotrites archaeon]